jgi:hypothetical protein
MMQVTFDFKGSEFEKAVLKAAAEGVIKKVRAIRCPEHGQHAKIVAKGRSGGKLNFEVSGCCAKLIQEVESKLK